ncbi:MAG: (Fe-S)-binding protein [Planctomycetota bacterium]
MKLSELARACVHCGLCLPACPTYRVLREETDSPRGRVLLLEALEAGRASAREVRAHIDRCVGCRACESVCPSGVPYGEFLEAGRMRLGGPRPLVRLLLRHVVVRPRLVAAAVRLARLLGRLPPRTLPPAWPRPLPLHRGSVALHVGCVTPHLYPRLAVEAAQVLTRLGYRVEVPPDQTCCGALHRHAGLDARALEERNARAFEPYDVTVSAAAGCSTSRGLTDLCALLLKKRPFPGARLPPTRVVYDAPCHLLHAQGVDAAPLLDTIEGVERVPLAGAEQCCGAGGIYMQLQPRLARAVRETKLDAIEASGAQVVATPNPGCMLWLERGLRERGARVAVLHPVSLLARAFDHGAGGSQRNAEGAR